MPKKTKIIFIIVFILTGLIILGVYFWINKDKTINQNGETSWYQNFNPFGSGSKTGETTDTNTTINNGGEVTENQSSVSKFFQITDFAIAGATFLEDERPIDINNNTEPEEVKTIITPDTIEGRKDIQIFLNEKLSLKKPLVIDGVFGKSVTEAIKEFQKINNIPTTGILDEITSPYFTKTTKTSELENKVEKVPSIRFVERKNGHIYKMFLDKKEKEKISNSTIPSIYEALFDSTGKTVIYRYLSGEKIINTYVATIGASSGLFLQQNINDISVSQDKTKFFYLTKNENGVIGNIGILGEQKRDVVFNHPLTEWISSWGKNQNIYLTTKASYTATGSIFLLNTFNQTISKVFGGVIGLTTQINKNSTNILYNESTDSGPKLGVFNIKNHTTKDLDIYGLPEKCVWSDDNINIYCAVPNEIKGNQYPDSWYQGIVSFDDFFVKINTETGDRITLANSVNETPVDGTYLFLDKDESTLFFTNKKDSTLWSLQLK